MEGWKQNKRPALLVYRKKAPLPVSPATAAESRALAESQHRVEEFEARFKTRGNVYQSARHTFQNDQEFEATFELHARQLIIEQLKAKGHDAAAVDRALPPPVWPDRCPFRGLSRFEYEHAPIFFGRERPTREIIRRLESRHDTGSAFVLLVGGSGSGKSSLLRAGVIPQLVKRASAGDDETVFDWRVAIASLDESGRPAEIISRALRERAKVDPEGECELPPGVPNCDGRTSIAALAEKIQADPGFAAGIVCQDVAKLSDELRADDKYPGHAECRLLLFVDQFEQLFDDQVSVAVRAAVIRFLRSLAESGRGWVVAALRSDFYDQFLDEQELVALRGENGQYDLSPPGASEIDSMIRSAASAAGIELEAETQDRDLVDLLVEATTQDVASLPLLSMCLERLYAEDCLAPTERTAPDILNRPHERKSSLLRLQTYQDLGGIEGVIGNVAERVLAELSPDELAKHSRVFARLVQLQDATVRPTSRSASLADLEADAATAAFLRKCVEYRLLAVSSDSESDDDAVSVRLTHESLCQSWPLLRNWIDNNRELLPIRSRIEAAANRWESSHRRADLLLPDGQPLAEAVTLENTVFDLSESETELIARSKSRAKVRRRIRRGAVATLAVLLVLLSALGILLRRNLSDLRELNSKLHETIKRLDTSNDQLRASSKQLELTTAEAIKLKNESAAQLTQTLFGNAIDAMKRDERSESLAWAVAARANATGYPNAAADAQRAELFETQVRTSILPLRAFQLTNTPRAVAISNDQGRFAVASKIRTRIMVDVWEANTLQPVQRLSFTSGIRNLVIALSPDGTQLAIAFEQTFDNPNGQLELWDVDRNMRQGPPLKTPGAVRFLKYSRDGKRLIAASRFNGSRTKLEAKPNLLAGLLGSKPKTGAVFVVDTETITNTAEHIEPGGIIEGLACDADGTTAIVNLINASDGERSVCSIDLSSNEIMRLNDDFSTAQFGTISPSGKAIVVTGTLGRGQILVNGNPGSPVAFQVDGEVSALRFLQDDMFAVTTVRPGSIAQSAATGEGVVRFYTLDGAPAVKAPLVHELPVTAVGLTQNRTSPQANFILTASRDKTVAVWNDIQSKLLSRLPHTDELYAAWFVDDGTAILGICNDGTIRRWELPGQKGQPFTAAFPTTWERFTPSLSLEAQLATISQIQQAMELPKERLRLSPVTELLSASSNGQWAIYRDEENLVRFESKDRGQVWRVPYSAKPLSGLVSPDDRVIATCSGRILDFSSDNLFPYVDVPESHPLHMPIPVAPSRIALRASDDGHLVAGSVEVMGRPLQWLFTRDSRQLWIAGLGLAENSGFLAIMDVDTGELVHQQATPSSVVEMRLHESAGRAALMLKTSEALLVSTARPFKQLTEIFPDKSNQHAFIEADAGHPDLVLLGSKYGTVQAFEVKSGNATPGWSKDLFGRDTITAIRHVPGTDWFIIGSETSGLKLIDSTGATLVADPEYGQVRDVVLDRGGAFGACTSVGDRIVLFSVRSLSPISPPLQLDTLVLREDNDAMAHLEFTDDGYLRGTGIERTSAWNLQPQENRLPIGVLAGSFIDERGFVRVVDLSSDAEYLHACIEHFESDWSFRLQLGRLSAEAGDYEAAVEQYTQALEDEACRRIGTVYEARADALAELHRRSAAAADRMQAIRLTPTDWRLLTLVEKT